jgi:hypothetical protein
MRTRRIGYSVGLVLTYGPPSPASTRHFWSYTAIGQSSLCILGSAYPRAQHEQRSQSGASMPGSLGVQHLSGRLIMFRIRAQDRIYLNFNPVNYSAGCQERRQGPNYRCQERRGTGPLGRLPRRENYFPAVFSPVAIRPASVSAAPGGLDHAQPCTPVIQARRDDDIAFESARTRLVLASWVVNISSGVAAFVNGDERERARDYFLLISTG